MTDVFNMNPFTMSFERREVVIHNMKIELAARAEKLRAMEAAQEASMKARLERRVNRVPAALRNITMAQLLAPASESKPEPAYAAPTKAAITKQRTAAAAAPASAPAPPPATRKTRAAPAAATTTTTKTAPAAKTTTKTAMKPATTRTKKRSSDEMSSEDKENNALDVPKKRVRNAPKAAAPITKATTRTTRAASRQKAAPSQILSPKNNNSRQKPAKAITRPR